MINEFKVLSVIKDTLDADASFKTLVFQVGDSSKVIIGPLFVPSMGANPTVNIFFNTVEGDEEAKWDTSEIWFEIHSSDDPTKGADVENLSAIAERIWELMDRRDLTITGYHDFNLQFVGQLPTAPMVNPPDGKPAHQQTLRFAFRGTNT